MVNAYPRSLKEALEMRSEGFRPMGGGTDLMVRYRNRSGLLPRFDQPLLFLRNLEELKTLEERDGFLRIGAAVTLRELLASPLTPGPLKDIFLKMASYAIRSEATLAGNIGNASPAADSLPFLYCRDSSLTLASRRAERTVSLADFITGPGKTLLGGDEIIRDIVIPLKTSDISFHKKVGGRRSDAISKLSFYGEVYRGSGGVEDVRLAFGSVAPRVVRLPEGEDMILKALAGKKEWGPVVEFYGKAVTPIDDQRSTAHYRKEVSLNLLNRFLELLTQL